MLEFLLFLSVFGNLFLFLFFLKKNQSSQSSYDTGGDRERTEELSLLKAETEQLKKEIENQKETHQAQLKQSLEREKQNYNDRLVDKQQSFEQIQKQKEDSYKRLLDEKNLVLKEKEDKHQEELSFLQKQHDKNLKEKEQYFEEIKEQNQKQFQIKEDFYKKQLEDKNLEHDGALKQLEQNYDAMLEEKEKLYKDREEYFTQLKKEFELISHKVLESKTENLQEESKKSLAPLLNPLKEEIKKFEERYNKESNERFSLKNEIKNLTDRSDDLTKALKGDAKTQGDWGEVVLENILKNSGLREGKDFVVQGIGLKLKGSEGQNLKPDVVVNLPDDRWIVIDSKVSLTSYYNYTTAQTEEEKEKCVKQIVKSLENHIDNLSNKKYHKAEGVGSATMPDFTLMFLPLEGALSLAVQQERYLFNKAWEKSIAIVSPITLYSSLKIISSLWKIDSQNKNAREIAKESGKLYEKLVGFIDDMSNVSGALDKAQATHSKAFNKLKEGRGNLVGRAEKIKKLGAKTDKSLPTSVKSYDLIEELNIQLKAERKANR